MDLDNSLKSDPIRRLDLSYYVEVQKGDEVYQVIEKMQASHRKCALVMLDGKLVGIFTAHDIRYLVGDTKALSKKIEAVMSTAPKTIDGDTSILEAIKILTDHPYRYVPVVNRKNRVIGTLTHYAVLKYMSDFFPEEIYNLPPEPHQIASSRAGA